MIGERLPVVLLQRRGDRSIEAEAQAPQFRKRRDTRQILRVVHIQRLQPRRARQSVPPGPRNPFLDLQHLQPGQLAQLGQLGHVFQRQRPQRQRLQRGQAADVRAVEEVHHLDVREGPQKAQVSQHRVAGDAQHFQFVRRRGFQDLLRREVAVQPDVFAAPQLAPAGQLRATAYDDPCARDVREMADDLLGVRVRVEAVPVAADLLEHRPVGVGAEPGEVGQRGPGTQLGRRVRHRLCLVHLQALRPRQQLQHHRAHLGQYLRLVQAARGDEGPGAGLHVGAHRRVQLRRMLQAGHRQQVEAACGPRVSESPRSTRRRSRRARSSGRAWATDMRITSSHWSWCACWASRSKSRSSTAALAPR